MCRFGDMPDSKVSVWSQEIGLLLCTGGLWTCHSAILGTSYLPFVTRTTPVKRVTAS